MLSNKWLFLAYSTLCVPLIGMCPCDLPTMQQVKYPLTSDPIDVVIPCHEKDTLTLNESIHGIRKYIKNVNRIIVVSERKFTDQAEWFDERQFPFTKETLALEIFHGNQAKALEFMYSPQTRIGWIYQQILKLYASFVIPNISPNVLIVDADTIFLRPVTIIDEHGVPLFDFGEEYTKYYFEHGARLIPGFKKVFPKFSGICHHMLFQRCILEDLFNIISQTHGIEPWKALCRCIDTSFLFACISEYELYFNFVFLRTDQMRMQKLKWRNLEWDAFVRNRNYYHKRFDFVACHSWMRT